MDDADGEDEGNGAVSLLPLAGPRETPSARATAEARANVHAAWRAGVRRRRLRAGLVFGCVGLAALALGRLWSGRSGEGAREAVPAPPAVALPAVVARLDAAPGLVEAHGPSGWARLRVGDAVPVGGLVRAGAGGAGLGVDDGRSVRIAAYSRLRWVARDRLVLEEGAVYVDSGGQGRGSAAFEVATARGRVRESGTQFEVRLEPDALRVRVREGRVSLAREGAAVEEVPAGTEMRLDERGTFRRAVPAYGAEWSWVMALAPAYEMDGRTLHEVASWVAREAGWRLRYAGEESRRRATAAILHGSIRGLRTDEAVAAVTPSAGMSHRVEDGVLWIGPGAALAP